MIVLLAVLQNVSALYFYVTEGQHRCFLEEVPKDTLIVAHYDNKDLIGAANGQDAQVRCAPSRLSQHWLMQPCLWSCWDACSGAARIFFCWERFSRFGCIAEHQGHRYRARQQKCSRSKPREERECRFRVTLPVNCGQT